MARIIHVTVAPSGFSPTSIKAKTGDTIDFQADAPTTVAVSGLFGPGPSYPVPSQQIIQADHGTFTLVADHNEATVTVKGVRERMEPKPVPNPRP